MSASVHPSQDAVSRAGSTAIRQPPTVRGEKVTVIISCKNERMNIRPCIESARLIADEIIVADSGSTDESLDIIRSMGDCRIIEREYVHSGDFKNWAIPQATHEWVFILDADERITPEMAEEIQTILANGARHPGYWVYRFNYFMGHPIRFSGWRNDKVLRFFRRDVGRYEGDTDHAEVALRTGTAGRLKTRMLHYTYWTYHQYVRKLDRYTSFQAEQWQKGGRRPSYLRLLLHAPVRFFRCYVLQLGFLDGQAGLQLCMMSGFYSFMKQARLWERCHAKPQPNPESDERRGPR